MERAVSDLLAMLGAAALESGDARSWDERGAEAFRRHHSQLMYQVQSSLPLTCTGDVCASMKHLARFAHHGCAGRP